MGKLSRCYLGLNKLPKNAIMIAGFHTPQKIRDILKLFENAKRLIHPATQPHLVSYKGKKAIILFNIWGPARSLSILRILNDGGCKRIFLLGWTGTKKDIPIGTFIIPKKVRCLDGITLLANRKVKYAYPDKKLFKDFVERLKKNEIEYKIGITISEPTVWHKIPYIERESKKYLAADMELAPLLYFSKIIGIKSLGMLIVTDNPKIPLTRFRTKKLIKQRYKRLREGIKLIKDLL